MSMQDLKNGLLKLFTNDPINWIKWVIVFAVLVLGYVILIKSKTVHAIYYKWEIKRDKARAKGNIIKATLIKSYPYGDPGSYSWTTTYEYTLNGETKKYRAYFNNASGISQPPRILYLYYINSPKHLFSVEEYHWDGFSGIVIFLITFAPWFLAAFFVWLLKIDISGF